MKIAKGDKAAYAARMRARKPSTPAVHVAPTRIGDGIPADHGARKQTHPVSGWYAGLIEVPADALDGAK